jgi:DNA-binding transcriptional ArsR family regulator
LTTHITFITFEQLFKCNKGKYPLDTHVREKNIPDSETIENVKKELPGYDIIDAMAQFFGLLSDPTRLKIVIILKKEELCVHEIASAIGISISAVSHQLRLLKTAKMVKSRRQGKMIYYSLDDEHIEQLLSVADEHVKE